MLTEMLVPMPEVSAANCPLCHAMLNAGAKTCQACGLDLAAWKQVRPCMGRAEAYLQAGMFADAKTEFRQALSFDPGCTRAREGIAKAEEQIKNLRVRHLWSRAGEAETQGDFANAEALFREIASLDPKDQKAAGALAAARVKACLRRGEASLLDGRFADAREEFQQALLTDPGCEQALKGIAKADEQIRSLRLRHLRSKAAEAEVHKDFRTAEALYREVLSLEPGDEKAKAATEALGLAARESVKACLQRAEALLADGMFADAKDEFQKALLFDPACEQARKGVAKAAEEVKALRLRHLWSRAGEAETQGDFKTALGAYRDILGLEPGNKKATEAAERALKALIRPFLDRAEACFKAERFADARNEFQQALAFDPACEQAKRGLAKADEEIRLLRLRYLWDCAGEAEAKEDFAAATARYRDIISLDPGDMKAKSAAEALDLLRRIAGALKKLQPDYKEALRLAGEIIKKGLPNSKAVEKANILLGLKWDLCRWVVIGLLLGVLVGWQGRPFLLPYVHNDSLVPVVAGVAGAVLALFVIVFGYRRSRIARVRSLRIL